MIFLLSSYHMKKWIYNRKTNFAKCPKIPGKTHGCLVLRNARDQRHRNRPWLIQWDTGEFRVDQEMSSFGLSLYKNVNVLLFCWIETQFTPGLHEV